MLLKAFESGVKITIKRRPVTVIKMTIIIMIIIIITIIIIIIIIIIITYRFIERSGSQKY